MGINLKEIYDELEAYQAGHLVSSDFVRIPKQKGRKSAKQQGAGQKGTDKSVIDLKREADRAVRANTAAEAAKAQQALIDQRAAAKKKKKEEAAENRANELKKKLTRYAKKDPRFSQTGTAGAQPTP